LQFIKKQTITKHLGVH